MTQAWNKENSESPTGIEPMTSRTRGGSLSTELQELMESYMYTVGHLTEFKSF